MTQETKRRIKKYRYIKEFYSIPYGVVNKWVKLREETVNNRISRY